MLLAYAPSADFKLYQKWYKSHPSNSLNTKTREKNNWIKWTVNILELTAPTIDSFANHITSFSPFETAESVVDENLKFSGFSIWSANISEH